MSRKKRKEQETGLERGSEFSPRRLRPIDIQKQEFSTSFRGYEPTEVDAFLDRLTEDFAGLHEENKRLMEGGPVVPASGVGAADAEAILAQARAQADAIVAEARTRAVAVGGTTSSAAPGSRDALSAVWPFLAKEREFLRALAASVQEHAEGVKRQVKQIQESSSQSPPPATSGPAPADPSAHPVARPAATADPVAESAEAASGSAWTQTARDGTPPAASIPPTPVATLPSTVSPELEDEADDGSGGEPTLRDLFWNEEG